MGFLFGSPSSISTSEVALGGLRIQSAGYGVAIPINYGKNRVPPTLIWYGNFKAIPHTTTQESGGKGGGGAESSNTTYTYTAGVIFSLGEGPVADIIKTWVDKQSHASPAEVGLSKFLGTYPQTPWGWLQAYAPGQALGYQGIVYVAASDYSVNGNASLGNHSFEVSGRLKEDCNDDVNPKDIIVDFLTNANYGVPGFPTSRIADLTQLSNYCDAAGVRISPSLATQRAAHEWLTEFAQMANSAPVWSEGKLKVLPYCDEAVSGSVGSPGDGSISTVFSGTGTNDQYLPDVDVSIAGNPLAGEIWVNHYTGVDHWALLDVESGTEIVSVLESSFANFFGVSGIDATGNALGHDFTTNRLWRISRDGTTEYVNMSVSLNGTLGIVSDANGDIWAINGSGGSSTGAIYKITGINWTAHTCSMALVTGRFFRFLRNASGIAGRIYGISVDPWPGTTQNLGYIDTTTLVVTQITSGGLALITPRAVVGQDGNIYSIEANTLKKYSQNGALLESLAIPVGSNNLLYDGNGFLWISFTSVTDIYKVNAGTMTLNSTIAAGGYTHILAESFNGSPVLFGLSVPGVGNYGKIGIIRAIGACFAGNVTYTPDTTPAYNLTDDDYIISGDDPPIVAIRKKQTTAFNLVQVEYLDRANDYNIAIAEVKDQASIEAYGVLPLPVLRLHAITTSAVAMQVAQAVLQRVCYVRKGYKFRLSLKYSRLEPMDGLTLTDSRLGMNQFPVRVTEVSEDGDEVLSITAEERDLGISSANTYDAQGGGAGYTPDYSVVPGNVNPPDVFIAPANLTVSGYEVWAAISNADPNYGGCHIWASYDNATYQKIGTLLGNSRQGFITAALSAGADPDTVNTLAVDLTESAGALNTANQPAVDAFDTLCLVGNEFVAYRDAALTAASKYDLTYLRRGVYGSTQGAVINARFVRCDQALFKYAFDPALWGFTLYLKFVGFNTFGRGLQDIATLTPVTVALSGSLTRPAPPSNFYIGQSGALVAFSWTPSPSLQVRWNELRYVLQGAPVRWLDGIVLNGAAAGAAFETSRVIPGAWSFMLAAEDAGGSFSTPVTRDFIVANANTVLHATQEAISGDTAGSTLTNMVKHWTGKFFPRSQNLANADAWDTFDIFVPNPYADCAYEPAEIDLGSDQTVRAWAALWADMMPDTTLGFAQPQLLLDYKLAAGTYGGFQAWTINSLTARYVKMKFTLNTAQGTPVIRLFNPTLDA